MPARCKAALHQSLITGARKNLGPDTFRAMQLMQILSPNGNGVMNKELTGYPGGLGSNPAVVMAASGLNQIQIWV